MTATYCQVVVKPSEVLMARSMNLFWNRWSITASVSFLAGDLEISRTPFLWHSFSSYIRRNFVVSDDSVFPVVTHTLQLDWYSLQYNTHWWINSSPVTLVSCNEALLQELKMEGWGLWHLALTVMKHPFNARWQPTRVESSLSQGVEVALSYS